MDKFDIFKQWWSAPKDHKTIASGRFGTARSFRGLLVTTIWKYSFSWKFSKWAFENRTNNKKVIAILRRQPPQKFVFLLSHQPSWYRRFPSAHIAVSVLNRVPVGFKNWGSKYLFNMNYHTTYLIFMKIGLILFEKMDSKVLPILYHYSLILKKSLTSDDLKSN